LTATKRFGREPHAVTALDQVSVRLPAAGSPWSSAPLVRASRRSRTAWPDWTMWTVARWRRSRRSKTSVSMCLDALEGDRDE